MGQRPDDALAAQRGLQIRIAHVARQHIGDGVLEEHARVLAGQRDELLARRRRARPRVARAVPQRAAQPVEQLLVGDDALDVARGGPLPAQVRGDSGRVEVLGDGAPVGSGHQRFGSASVTR